MKLYIIHGWAYSIEPWQQTVDRLRASGHDVVQLRVPGLTEPSEAVWDIDGYVDWLHKQLSGEDRPIVLGHSNGGRIALHYLRKYPDGVSKLILLDSAGIEVAEGRLSIKRRVLKLAAKLLKPLKYIPGLRKIVYRLLGSDYGQAPANMQKTLANMLSSDRGFSAKSVTVPTAILWGADDRVTPPSMADKLHSQIAGSTLKIMPAWRHSAYMTHPNQLADEIEHAMESLS